MHKDVRKLIREIEANGFAVQQGRSHLLIKAAGGGAIASLPLTPGRGRWEKNLRAELRRKGVLPQ
jgi:hypothetical protein